MAEADKSAWCREQGIYPAELEKWCASAASALCDPQDASVDSNDRFIGETRLSAFV
jgi:hypothetical protein